MDGHDGQATRLEIPPVELAHGCARARAYFAEHPEDAWRAYVAGPLVALGESRPELLREGARIFVGSTVPEGKGVSGSSPGAFAFGASQLFRACLERLVTRP